jgi:hypothetical protein
MQPTSTFCRAQEARQHALAIGTGLVNARDIATIAAAAWAKEAMAAEKREERMMRRDAAGHAAMLRLEPMPHEEYAFSENPDRGFTTRI